MPQATTTATSPTATAATTQECHTRDLALAFGDPLPGMTGERSVLFSLTNTGRTACHLLGYPHIVLFDRAGQPLPFHYAEGHTQYVTGTQPRPITLAPGSHAYFLVAKYRCDPGDLTAAQIIRVTLAADATPLTGPATTAPGPAGLLHRRSQRPGQIVAVSPVASQAGATAG